MNSRRTTTPFTIRTKESYCKKPPKNTIGKPANEYSNPGTVVIHNQKAFSKNIQPSEDAIRRSTSFKSKAVPQRLALGCTYYPKDSSGEPSSQKPKSASRKKRLVSMHKTAADWNQAGYAHDYSYDSCMVSVYGNEPVAKNQKSRTHTKNQFSSQKPKMQLVENTTGLPKIIRKEQKRFVPENVAGGTGLERKDEYIRYIISKKKAKAAAAAAEASGRLSRAKVRGGEMGRRADEGTPAAAESARRGSKDTSTNNTIDNTPHSFNLGGITFEVHSKRGTSPSDSVEYLRSQVSKEMNLMFYDFNGAAKRLASESPQPKEYPTPQKATKPTAESTIRMIYQNKTAEKFFQRKANAAGAKKMKSTASTHDATGSEKPTANSVKHSMIEDDEDDPFSSGRSDTQSTGVTLTTAAKIVDQAKINTESKKRSKSPPTLASLTNNSKFYVRKPLIISSINSNREAQEYNSCTTETFNKQYLFI